MSVCDLREVEVCFISFGLANRDDTVVVSSRGMRNGYDFAVKQSKSKKSLLTIALARIFGGDGVTGEDYFSVSKIDTMFYKVPFALRFVPCEHESIVATYCSYYKQLLLYALIADRD